MQNPSPQHKILISSLAKAFILQKRSFPYQEPHIQVYQNEIYINNAHKYSSEWTAFEDGNLKKVFDDLTKKINLYRIRSIDSLSLNFIGCKSLTNESAKYLRQNLIRNVPCLKSLALSFYGFSEISEKGVEQIAELISYFKGLESLQIRFVTARKISDETIRFLMKKLQRSQRHLKSLVMDFSGNLKFAECEMQPTKPDLFQRISRVSFTNNTFSTRLILSCEGIFQLSFAIVKYFQRLEDLDLNLSSLLSVTDLTCQYLGKNILERMEFLKRLSLNLNKCSSLTDEGMFLFNGSENRRRVNLKHLTLELEGLSISDKGLKSLGEGISLQFKDLKRLNLNLMWNQNITEDGFKQFNSKITSSLKSLQSFTLATLGSANFRSTSIEALSSDISIHLKEIKELGLIFSGVESKMLPVISSNLDKSPTKLDKLSVELQISSSLNFMDVQQFSKIFKTSLKDLQVLNFGLSGNDTVNNELVNEFGRALECLEKLKRLALDFQRCDDLIQTSERFSLVPLIPKAVFLETFEIFLAIKNKITEESLDEFGEYLCEFQPRLALLHINFSLSKGITEKSFEKFCKRINQYIKGLDHLTLDFHQCEKITLKSKINLRTIFKGVPMLTIY